jgi:ABC-type transporter Mla subunit MlaD
MANNQIEPQASSRRIEEVLRANRQVAADIKDTAEELEVVHAVLDSKVPEIARVGDVGAAIDRTEVLQKQLKASSEQLDAANAALNEASFKLDEKGEA